MTPPPTGWTPYADGSWPPDGATVDVLLKTREVVEGVRYRHWDLLEHPPGFPLRAAVVAWREGETKHPGGAAGV